MPKTTRSIKAGQYNINRKVLSHHTVLSFQPAAIMETFSDEVHPVENVRRCFTEITDWNETCVLHGNHMRQQQQNNVILAEPR